jgi:beta-glucosidase
LTITAFAVIPAIFLEENGMRMFRTGLSLLILFSVSFLSAQTTHLTPAEVEKRVDSILSKMTLNEKIDYIGGVNSFYIRAIPRLGLPAFKMADGPLGVRNYGPSTTLAGGVNLAATWDPALVRRAGVVLGEDARARGVHFLLGPGVNIYRAPMNGRSFEYFGEDPYLSSQIAVAYIEGLQSQDVCATIKHFTANNSEYLRHDVNDIIDERTLREIYLPVFEAAVKQAHVCAIMDSYNLVNGEHSTQNGHLNVDIAKKDWGFPGIIMSDWDATYDGVAAVNNGMDLEMPYAKFMNRETLLPAIKDGKVSVATIDDHVRRILRVAVEMGWLDHDQTDLSISRYNLNGRAVSEQAAHEGMVLLKNENHLLPLDKAKIKTLAVIGPDAYPGEPGGGGSASVVPFHTVSFLEGLANIEHGINVTYNEGIPTRSEMAAATSFSTTEDGKTPGLNAEYFTTPDLTGDAVKRVDRNVNFGDEHPYPSNFASARWTGYYIVNQPGDYQIFVQSFGESGGTRLFFDGKELFNNWKQARALVAETTLHLDPGAHQVRFEAYMHWRYRGPMLQLGIVNLDSVVSDEVKALAGKADAVVVPVGFDRHSESEGSDRTFELPPAQNKLIQELASVNKHVIVVVTSGGAVDMTPWIDRVPAVFESWYAGQEGGTALAQLLFGDFSPSGKLPITMYRRWEDSSSYGSYYPNAPDNSVKYLDGVFVGYRHDKKADVTPLFPFGYGLSYTTFKFSNLAISPSSTTGENPVTVSFDVTNTGRREGAEVAELYVSDPSATVPRPPEELKGFERVDLKPGETKKVTLHLNHRSFSYYDVSSHSWKADPGEFGILVGSSSEKLELKGTVKVTQ